MDSSVDAVYEKSDNVVAREIEGELIVIPMIAGIGDMENEIYALEGTGQDIWRLIDGKKTIADIVRELEKTYEAEEGIILQDVLGLISEIEKRQFISRVNG